MRKPGWWVCVCSALIPEMNLLLLAGCSEGSLNREFLQQNLLHGPGTLQQSDLEGRSWDQQVS